MSTTNQNGVTRLRLPTEPGEYTIRATAGNRTATQSIQIRESTPQMPATVLSVPNETGVFGTPTARLQVSNPWATNLTTEVSLSGPGGSVTESVRLRSGESQVVSTRLDRRPPGTYTVRATIGEETLRRDYRVTGDDRLASAIASSGRVSAGAGTGGLLSRAFGNIGLVLATLLALGVVMTAGSTIAAFADAVQARREEIGIHRAVGAGPVNIVRAVGADALRIALPAGLFGVGVAVLTLVGLSWAGVLTVFGVELTPRLSGMLLGTIALSGLAVALVSAFVVVVQYTRVDPSQLFGGGR